jgi:hypothetical protein
MEFPRARKWHFWSAESGLTSLLVVTVISLFFTCALGEFPMADLIADILFSLILATGVMATFRQYWLRILAIVVAVISLVLTWKQYVHPKDYLIIPDNAFKIIFLGLLLAVLAVQVFRAGPVTSHRIRGAVVIYLLLGVMWGLFYNITAVAIPRAFHFAHGMAVTGPRALDRLLTYFSFTTLTTTGFGDITPIAPMTRTLAIFEALAGQLYLVITLARLVSLGIVKANEPDQPES